MPSIFDFGHKPASKEINVPLQKRSQRSLNFEMPFWCLQILPKTNENKSTRGIIVVKVDFFVGFFEEN